MVTNKDLWDECEVNILMNGGGTYGTRLSDSRITNEQLTTPVSSSSSTTEANNSSSSGRR